MSRNPRRSVVSDAENRSADDGNGGGLGKRWFMDGSNPAKSSKGPGGSIVDDSMGPASDMEGEMVVVEEKEGC